MPTGALRMILEQTREIPREVVAAEAERSDRQGAWPAAGIRALQQHGLAGLVIPETSGGLGQGLLALAQVCEILGYECGSTALCFGMHCVGSIVIAAKATPDQQQRYLEPISAGKHLTTLALSEPGTGAHFYLPETTAAIVSPDTFQVTGVKTFVTNGGYADSYVVSTAPAQPDAPPGMFSCVIVQGEAEGIVWGPPWNGFGMRGNSSRTMELRGVAVPYRDLIGEEGDQIWYVFQIIVPYFLMAMAGTYLGIVSAALDEAQAHLRRRRYTMSGSGPGSQSIIQHRLGTLWAQVERTRRLIYYAGTQGDRDGEGALPAIMSAKAEVADCTINVVNEAMTLSGGIGYRENAKLSRLLRDARAAHIMGPTTDILRTWVGRLLLDQPLLGD